MMGIDTIFVGEVVIAIYATGFVLLRSILLILTPFTPSTWSIVGDGNIHLNKTLHPSN